MHRCTTAAVVKCFIKAGKENLVLMVRVYIKIVPNSLGGMEQILLHILLLFKTHGVHIKKNTTKKNTTKRRGLT